MHLLRSEGDFIHNTNPEHNSGQLIVRRRPKLGAARKLTDYKSCPRCMVTLLASNARHHISKCTKQIIKGERMYTVLSRMVEGRLHADASDTLRLVIFPVLREDDIVRILRYDWLVIVYGNKLCLKYTPHFQHNMIRARLRLIGRFLKAARALCPDITDLASVFQPKLFRVSIEAIKIVAQFHKEENVCKAPATAENLVTYIKQIGEILESEYIIKEDKINQEKVINYLKLHKQYMPIEVNKLAMEIQSQKKRQKIIILPLLTDISKLVSYLSKKRRLCVQKLSEKFIFSEWLNLLKFTAVYIFVFNRRRVGDIQNILMDDLDYLEKIDEKADKEMYNLLDDEGKKLAGKYFRILVRGKLNRDVPVLLTADLLEEIHILLKYRSSANVADRNKYLFGLPNPIDTRIRVVNLCYMMRKVSKDCGAEKPDLLRGTALRKHIATKCVELELQDNEVLNIANHLGHSDKIHHDIYRQPIKNKVIVQISKLLEHAAGTFQDEKDDDDEINSESEYHVIPEESETVDNLSARKDVPIASSSFVSFSKVTMNTSSSSVGCDKDMIKTSSSSIDFTDVPEKNLKKRWSEEEKAVVLKAFAFHIKNKKNPSFAEINAIKAANLCLSNRSKEQIKTWVSNPFLKTKNSSNIRVRENKQVKLKVKLVDRTPMTD